MVVTVPGFAGVAPSLRGSPLHCPAMPMYMVWHLRHPHDPVHRWLRRELEAVAAAVLQPA